MDKVIDIAKKVRKEALEVAKKEGFQDSLSGLCARASAKLHKELIKEGIKAKLHVAVNDWNCECHVFTSVDGKIIDITAKQFNNQYKDIEIVPLKDRNKPYYWKIHKTFRCTEELQKHQQKRGWPKEQTAEYGTIL